MLEPDAYLFTTPECADRREQLLQAGMAADATQAPDPAAAVLQHPAQLRELSMLSIGAKMNFISAQTGDREETLKKHYAKYLEGIDPQRDWIEDQIRKSEKSSKKVKNRSIPTMQNPTRQK